jgi:hypothetical protein
LEELKSHSYSILNKEGILAPPILSGFCGSQTRPKKFIDFPEDLECYAIVPVRLGFQIFDSESGSNT